MTSPLSDNTEGPRDRKPWRCVNCSDRFARDQTPGLVHWTEYAPREMPTNQPTPEEP